MSFLLLFVPTPEPPRHLISAHSSQLQCCCVQRFTKKANSSLTNTRTYEIGRVSTSAYMNIYGANGSFNCLPGVVKSRVSFHREYHSDHPKNNVKSKNMGRNKLCEHALSASYLSFLLSKCQPTIIAQTSQLHSSCMQSSIQICISRQNTKQGHTVLRRSNTIITYQFLHGVRTICSTVCIPGIPQIQVPPHEGKTDTNVICYCWLAQPIGILYGICRLTTWVIFTQVVPQNHTLNILGEYSILDVSSLICFRWCTA